MEIKFVSSACCKCGIQVFMSEVLMGNLKRTGRVFHCLNGHPQSFKDTDAKKIRELEARLVTKDRLIEREREWYNNERNGHNHTMRRLSATQGVVTKMRKAAEA